MIAGIPDTKDSFDSASPKLTPTPVGARHRRARFHLAALLTATCAVFLCIAAADGAWLQNVPDADRQKVNPFAGQQDAVAAGNRIFQDHCAKCHGDDGTGRKKKPSLRTDRVQKATDGEIFWLLKNGSLKHGMPSWSAMPEPMRWQVVTFVKSLGTSMFGQSNFVGGSEESGR
jgi:mono/diheme cytochrome c family protein